MPLFALIDCNNFYVSCERVFNPALIGKPVIVLSNNDGCVIARSNEAKKLGIAMGQPLFECQSLIAKHQVQVYSSNFTLYGDMSARVMETVAQMVPHCEVYSIDEIFVQLDAYDIDPAKLAQNIRKTVYRWTGIPVSIGIGQTKTLAKIANKVAKKEPRHNGVYFFDQEKRDELLARVPVCDVWGIGPAYTKLLNRFMIHTAYDLIQARDEWIRKKMTIAGLKTVWELRGTSCISLQEIAPDKKAIACTRSFGNPVRTKKALQEAISSYVSRAAHKLRAQDSVCAALYVFCMTSRFAPDRYFNSKTVCLPEPTSYTPTLIRAAQQAIDELFHFDYVYKKVGVVLTDISSASQKQVTFLSDSAHLGHDAIMKSLDTINNKWGKNAVYYAAQGITRSWQMSQSRKSAAFTTSWHELLRIKI